MHSSSAGRHAAFEHLELPDVDLRHLRTLTDDTGIIQHAKYAIPDRNHGYCVDDNARALIVASCHHSAGFSEDTSDLASVYLAFLYHAFNPERGRFRNFMSYDRQWLEEEGSEDSHGRAIWGLGVAAAKLSQRGEKSLPLELIESGAPAVENFGSPRAWAYTILGLDEYLDVSPEHDGLNDLYLLLAIRLQDQFAGCRSDDWEWCEDILAYSNAVLPYALLVAGRRLRDESLIDLGIRSLRWLLDQQTAPEGHLSIIGNDGWLRRGGGRARYDQQPVDAMGLVLATLFAHSVTGDECWRREAARCIGWFVGENDIGLSLVDPLRGGCRDGLSPSGVNENQGAESTLAWLIALQALHAAMPVRRPVFATVDGVDDHSNRNSLRAFVRTNGNGHAERH